MKTRQAMPSEVRDNLEVLLAARSADHPTFRRMVGWYRDVADELGCRDGYEQMLASLLIVAGTGANGEWPMAS
jgi:hypothetical protein